MSTQTAVDDIQLKIPSSIEYIGIVRLMVAGIAARMNFQLPDIEDIKVAVSEACTNAVLHAYSEDFSDQPGIIEVIVQRSQDRLIIKVQDYGKGFDTSIIGKSQIEEKLDDNQHKGLGLGCTFIKNLMDDVHFFSEQNQGSLVTMVKLKK